MNDKKTSQNALAIKQLFDFLENRLLRLEKLSFDNKDEPIKQMIVYTFIDSISAIVYPKEKRNRVRFVKILCDHANWKYSNSISWPHLSKFLQLVNDKRFSSAKEKFSKIEGNYKHGEFRNLELDPSFDMVSSVWPARPDAVIENIASLNSLRHVELMYASRNKLVHEHLESGNG